MARPFQQLGIVGLEDLFVKSEGELQVLRDLEYELRHRQVPRARSLMVKVRAAIKVLSPAGIEVAVTPKSSDLPVRAEGDLFESESARSPEQKPPGSPAKLQPQESFGGDVPRMPLAEAYKMLNVAQGSSWESIELARRQLVQRASPVVAIDEKRQQLQRDAERINAAYMVIALERVKCR